MGAISYIGPAILLISALLTAGYLLPITVKGFLPGKDFEPEKPGKIHVSAWMLIPMIILGLLSLVLGIIPGFITDYLWSVAISLM